MPIEERVEGVKKFLLGPFFSAEKLNVIDEQQFGLTITFTKFDQVIVLDRINEFVDEKLAGEIHHFARFLFRPDVMSDRLHQVSLAQPDAAVDKERVVGAGG